MERTLRILQVEDSLDDAELILRELRRGGHDIEAVRVETSTAMVNALCDRDWDLVLSDYDLPGFGGMEALRVLQASGIDIPFIVVSGAIGEEIAVATMKAGAHDYVFKGNLARLGPAIERELKEAEVRRKQTAAGNALRESEHRYRVLFEHSPMPINLEDFSAVKQLFMEFKGAGVGDFRTFFLTHPDAVRRCAAAVKVVDMNERSLTFFGRQKWEGAPLSLPEFFLESSWAVFTEEMITLAEGGKVFSCEMPLRDWTGVAKVLSLKLSVCPGYEQDLRRVLVSFLDITERKQAEAALMESEARLRQAAEATEFGVYSWDFLTQDTYYSPEFLKIYGLVEGQVVAVDEDLAPKCLHPADKASFVARMTAANDPGGDGTLENDFRILRPDGQVRWLHAQGRTTFSEGVPSRANGILQDVTNRKLAEAALRVAKDELELFFQLIPDLACVASLEGYFTKLNPVWEELLGYTEAELLSRPFSEFTHPEDVESTLREVEKQVAGSGTIHFINRYRTKDGSYRWLEWHASPAVNGQLFAAARDITERRQLEAVLKDMERLSAKGQMAAYIAHEINNPLAGIKNAFALVEGAIPETHPYFKYVELIKREIDRIAGIIRTMYHVYRPQGTTIVDVSLLDAFQDIQNLLVPKCRAAGVSIAIDCSDIGFMVRMNPGLLRQVLFNLVQNAVESSPPEGVVTLRAARFPGQIHITVEDMGQGIPPELADRIFEAGFTTKRDSGMSGLGLGLSACRNIMESVGGSLVFQPNANGIGVTFRINLPDSLA